MTTLTVRRYAAIECGTETGMHVHTETLTGLTADQARRERVKQLRADGVEHAPSDTLSGGAFAHPKEHPPVTTTATPPTTRPCACWTRIDPTTHGGHCRFGLEAPDDCHDDVLTAAARTTGPARFYQLPPGEKRDVLAQAVARLYPTEGS